MPKEQEDYKEIENLGQLKEQLAAPIKNAAPKKEGGEIIFDREGNMVVNNRKYRRAFKSLWRAVMEKQRSIHFYTKKRCKTNKKTKKAERQNRRKGRR